MSQSEDKERIVITNADLASEAVEQRVQDMARAQQVALVRDIGTPTKSGGGSAKAILILTAGGAVGGLLAFAFNWLLFTKLEVFVDNAFFTNLSFTFVLAVFIGAGVSLADVVANRSWAKLGSVAAIALPTAVGAALVMGLIAHFIYSAGQDWLSGEIDAQLANGSLECVPDQDGFCGFTSQITDFYNLRNHPIRGVAWMMVGIAAGIAAGAASRSWKRLGLAVLGGAIGGFIGGFVFDFITIEAVAQVVGTVLLGLLIGLATGIVEQAGKSRWIEIVSGGLAGKQFILYKPDVTLGSAPKADITLIKDAAIAPVAATVRIRGGSCQIEATGCPVFVNGSEIGVARLGDADIVTIGSTQLRFRERASAAKTPGQLR